MGHAHSCFVGLAAYASDPKSERGVTNIAIEEAVRVLLGGDDVDSRYHISRTLASDYKVASTVLGSGVSGDVKLAEREGKTYAVKSFRRHALTREKREENENEVDIFMSLEHRHIVRLLDVYDTQSEVHLVMEHMAGGELYSRLSAAKTYSEERAAATLRQMLLAVCYLHEQGIVHRDLKLENFLYEEQGTDHLKLIDFGFAQRWDPKTKMTKKCGTLHYVAPDVLKQSYDEKCDCWSLGVLAHMLLTGRAPFTGSDTHVIQKISKGARDPCPQFLALSSKAQSFISELLVLDPRKRLSAKDALAHDFLALQPCEKVRASSA